MAKLKVTITHKSNTTITIEDVKRVYMRNGELIVEFPFKDTEFYSTMKMTNLKVEAENEDTTYNGGSNGMYSVSTCVPYGS